MANRKKYIGDSVHAELSRDHLILTVENDSGPRETIYLEWDTVWMDLLQFVANERVLSFDQHVRNNVGEVE